MSSETETTIGDLVLKVRSKNAGPFWVTIDVFCGTADIFNQVGGLLSVERVASIFDQPAQTMQRYDIAELNVLKFSLPRPVVQGSRKDRDMHGAQWAVLLSELRLT